MLVENDQTVTKCLGTLLNIYVLNDDAYDFMVTVTVLHCEGFPWVGKKRLLPEMVSIATITHSRISVKFIADL